MLVHVVDCLGACGAFGALARTLTKNCVSDDQQRQCFSASALSRMAESDIAGVSASGSTLRWMIAGLPDFCAASKAPQKSAVFSTVAP